VSAEEGRGDASTQTAISAVKGERRVKQVKRLIVLLVLAFTLVLSPAVSAQPMKPLRCEVSCSIDWGLPGWKGEVTGDIEGTITYTLDVSTVWVKDDIEHFYETWVIVTDEGTISGFNEGIYMLKNEYMWVANGRVTDATGEWAYLVGCKEHELGTTTPFIWGGDVDGIGTLTIMPG